MRLTVHNIKSVQFTTHLLFKEGCATSSAKLEGGGLTIREAIH